MHRIFLPIYRFFQKNKALMYGLLIASTVVFGWFGSKLQYEEDIIKLLPRSSTSNELAFSDIGLIDKIFVQVTSRDTLNPLPPEQLGALVEEYCNLLEQKDSATHYLKGVFAALDIDTALEAMDYGLGHLPSFVDTSWYALIEQKLEPEAFQAQMEKNYDIPVDNIYLEGNGSTYGIVADASIDNSVMKIRIPQTSSKSLYKLLKEEADKGGDKLFYNMIYQPSQNAPSQYILSSNTNSKYVCLMGDYNYRNFDNYNYTVYIPKDTEVQAWIDAEYLPTWENFDNVATDKL